MPVNSRAKGARFERAICDFFKDLTGERARRTSDGYNQAGRGDILHPLLEQHNLHIECKHVEKLHFKDWIDQATADSETTGKMPAIVWRTNRISPPRIDLDLADFFKLIGDSE